MPRCAACNSRVEDGATRCSSCNASLVLPGAFLQTLGFVVIALATIPFAVAWIAEQEGQQIPFAVAGGVLLAGIIMVVAAKARNRAASQKVIPDQAPESLPPAP